MSQIIYSKEVIKHFKNPHNQGVIKNPTVVGESGNPLCGDMMKLYLKIEKKKSAGKVVDYIKDIKFETLGCAAAIATSSMITDLVKGQPLEEAAKVTRANIADSLGGLPPIKLHCSVLAVEALHDAIKKLKNNINNFMKDNVKKILGELRPTLQADGGDVELVDVDEKTGVVKVKLVGACHHCPMAAMTLEQGIARALKAKVKGVKEVQAV